MLPRDSATAGTGRCTPPPNPKPRVPGCRPKIMRTRPASRAGFAGLVEPKIMNSCSPLVSSVCGRPTFSLALGLSLPNG